MVYNVNLREGLSFPKFSWRGDVGDHHAPTSPRRAVMEFERWRLVVYVGVRQIKLYKS